MPLLANVRHEAFAQLVAKGQSSLDAYLKAGFTGNSGNASRLRSHPSIMDRVQQLRDQQEAMRVHSARDIELTKEWVIAQLVENVLIAKGLKPRPDLANANKALNLLGLELGMYVERKEIGTPGEFDGLSIEGKRDRVLSIATQLGLNRIKQDALDAIDATPLPGNDRSDPVLTPNP